MIKALIFDFDGTIADTLSFTFTRIIEIAKKYRLKNKQEEIIEKISHLTPSQLIKEFNISWLKIPLIIWEIKKAQKDLYFYIDKIKIFPFLKKTLKQLKKQGYFLYIYSSNIKKNIEHFLEKEKMNDLFKKIYTGSNLLGKDKDLIAILKKEKLKKDEVLYVADEIRDVLACKKIGIKMIGVSWGLAGNKGLKKHKVDLFVKNSKEIIKILNSLK
ncbi:MAG: HAD hydrolase-like protein [Patescibacteria group bacterium]|nr:HAD hydrolase-like protein [Patescibacteria group bacterium]